MARQRVRRAVAGAFSYKITENVRAAYSGPSKHGFGSNLALLLGTTFLALLVCEIDARVAVRVRLQESDGETAR